MKDAQFRELCKKYKKADYNALYDARQTHRFTEAQEKYLMDILKMLEKKNGK